MTTLNLLLITSGCLFAIGLTVVIIKRNTVMMLIGIELMLNASNINFVAFNRIHPKNFDGQFSAIFVIVVAVCEAAVGLAIVLRAYHFYKTSIPENINELKG